MIWLTIATILLPLLALEACGRKGDPIPQPRRPPAACTAAWAGLRTLEIRLPRKDVQAGDLVGLEALRLYYLPLGAGRPTPGEMLERGEVILERRRPDLPAPGEAIRLDLSKVDRSPGWMIAVALRVGNVLGEPGPVLAWLDPRISSGQPDAAPTMPPPPKPVAVSGGAPGWVPAP